MNKVIIPNNLDTNLYGSLRSIVEALERQEIKVGTEKTARGLRDGEMAVVDIKGEGRYLYTKQGKKLVRIPFQEVGRETGRSIATEDELITFSSEI